MSSEKEIFVITPIGKKGSETYKKYDAIFKSMILPSVEAIGENFKVTRADQIAKPGSFVKDILSKLKGSFIVIANLTDLNPNVFYELGVRHTICNRTIIITEDLSSVPSDLKEYRAIEYLADITGIEDFKTNLGNSMKEILKDPEHPDNPVQDRLGQIIKSREKELIREVEFLQKKKKTSKTSILKDEKESTDKRVERILKVLEAQEGALGSQEWLDYNENDEEIKIYITEPEGNFEYYFLDDESNSEYCLIMSIHNTSFNLDSDLADIRVTLQDYSKFKNIVFKFVISCHLDLSQEKSKITHFFKKALSLSRVTSPDNFSIEVWDSKQLLNIEKELGLKI